VFSTVHTNNTVATIGRLLDLGVDPNLIASSINLILAQRLTRKICEHCKEETHPDPTVLERLHLEGSDFTFYHGAGCRACGMTGYSGRIGLFEVLRMTPNLKAKISQRAPEGELLKVAAESGTVFLFDHAMERVRQGLTTVDELVRVLLLQEEEILRCPHCRTLINRDFAICPYCLFALKTLCESCRQELKLEWKTCPYCGTETPQAAAPPVEGQPRAEAESKATLRAEPFPTPAAQPPSPAPAPVPGKRPRILVVDDDDLVRTMVARALEPLPLHPELIQAADGPESLEAAKLLRPDLVILDLNMPRMDGFEVCRRLRASIQTTFVPILMLTASTDEQSRSQGFLVGTDDYMAKPVSIPELHARVTRLLRRTYGF
jgi:CheY-like chemotaxis protein/RNA polymerase subunit RPABC4/transcription elongation factor Spt4